MSGCGCVHISMYVFNFSVLIPFLCSSESIVSLMNTMCLSLLCTWEKFIRSCQPKMKTPPHETCHCLKWTQTDFLFVSACESSLLLWGRIPIPDATTHTRNPECFGLVDYCVFVKNKCIGWEWVCPSSGSDQSVLTVDTKDYVSY